MSRGANALRFGMSRIATLNNPPGSGAGALWTATGANRSLMPAGGTLTPTDRLAFRFALSLCAPSPASALASAVLRRHPRQP